MRTLLAILLLGACTSGFPTDPSLDDDDSTPPIVFDDDDDNTLADDDDTVADDDDTAPDDDDTAPDDDDTAPDDDDTASDDDDTADNFEGDEPGECTDGADNDQDGWFDCDDPDCWNSPDCQGDDDDAVDTFEGDEVGECEDGLDNDSDGLFDCDDPTCNMDPACGGGDDDDATAPPDGTPAITGASGSYDAGAGSITVTLTIIDGDCNLGNPTLSWSLNGNPQSPLVLGGTPLTCDGSVDFTLQSVSPGFSYDFTFQVTDQAGNLSLPWPITVVAS